MPPDEPRVPRVREEPSLEDRVRAIKARRKGCDHCESAIDEALAEIIAEARRAVAPVIDGELEGERRASEVMDFRLRAIDAAEPAPPGETTAAEPGSAQGGPDA